MQRGTSIISASKLGGLVFVIVQFHLYRKIFLHNDDKPAYPNNNPNSFNPYYYTPKSMSIDPAYGSSAFGIVVTQFVDDHIEILYAEEYHRPDYNEMLSVVYGLMTKYNVDKVYIDGANPSFIKSLKLQIGEDADYDKVIARYRSEGLGDAIKDTKVAPVNFNKEHKAILGQCKMIGK
jgi:hypothetical protein